MKLIVALAVALASVAAYDLRGYYIEPRNVFMPVIGQPDEQPDGRITNGADASISMFPYQVGLSLRVGSKASWCGGSLLNREWVLTAAHCTDGISAVIVHLGSSSLWTPVKKFTVKKHDIIIHPQWDRATLMNDISLIKIPAVEYSATIQPVKLRSIRSSYSDDSNEEVIASGWGLTYDGSYSINLLLQYVDMRTISNSQCRRIYGSRVQPSNICVATHGGKSTCRGDSGGPLVRTSDKVQIGLTSYGASAGCQKGYPVAFTRVASYLDWIALYTGI